MNIFAINTKIDSPCSSCDWQGDRNREECLCCQKKVDYLHLAHGEKWYSVAERDRQERAEMKAIIRGERYRPPAKEPVRYRVKCSVCGKEVMTKFKSQKTCGSETCKLEHKHKRDREWQRGGERVICLVPEN